MCCRTKFKTNKTKQNQILLSQSKRSAEVAMPKREQKPWEAIHERRERKSGRLSHQVFDVCRAGKKQTRVLHHLGSCYALPDIDVLDYSHIGERLPSRSVYDVIGRLCSRSGVQSLHPHRMTLRRSLHPQNCVWQSVATSKPTHWPTNKQTYDASAQ